MIYTVTFNPALDYVIHIDQLKQGEINRFSDANIFCGGKGINVSLVLKELKQESCALGFTAGFTGNEIEKRLTQKGIQHNFIHLDNGLSRINIKIKSDKETELNGQGSHIPDAAVDKLIRQLDRLSGGDYLILSGSIPSTLPSNIYEKILSGLEGRNIITVVDAAGDLLTNTLKYRPFLIKPNLFELSEIIGKKLINTEQIAEAAAKLQNRGARNVLVSMGEDGAVLADENGQILHCKAVSGKVKNSVGAGDSMVAGFVSGYISSENYEYALNLGSAAGSATAFSEELADKAKIDELFSLISIKKL